MKPARFHHDLIIDAASAVVAEQGPTGATISRIAKAAGAPTGSIYHRFSSRDVLLGEVWLSAAESFQSGFIDLLNANGTEPEIDDARSIFTKAGQSSSGRGAGSCCCTGGKISSMINGRKSIEGCEQKNLATNCSRLGATFVKEYSGGRMHKL